MFLACWSCKGGSGTTVVTASIALHLARRQARDVLLVDLGGDLPAVLGLPEPSGGGVGDWLSAGDDVPADALARLEVPVTSGVSLLPMGERGGSPERAELAIRLLQAEHRLVVVDAGLIRPGRLDDTWSELALGVARAASRSLLVVRPCYLALRLATQAPIRPSGVVVLEEPGRALDADDVAEVLGIPVVARLEVDAPVARAVDAGLLCSRLPRALDRGLREAA